MYKCMYVCMQLSVRDTPSHCTPFGRCLRCAVITSDR